MRTRKRNSPDVAISQSNDESSAMMESLSLIHAGELVTDHDIVVITPNWVKKMLPETGVVVGNESLKTLIHFVKAQNPRRIVVAAGSGGDQTVNAMREGGFDDVLQKEGIEFIDLNNGPFLRINLNHSHPDSTNVNRLFEEMTCLISFTQLKTHEEATLSAAVKNIALSWPPASEHGFPKKNCGIHDNLHGFIVAMAQNIPIDLAIVSANPAMVGTGPAKGIPVHTGLVIAGTDPFSVDTVCARLMGYKPQGVHYLFEGGNNGLGETDILKMNLYGIPLIDAEKAFTQKVYGSPVSVDAD